MSIVATNLFLVCQHIRTNNEFGSFWSYSHSVRSFRPDFQDELFRPNWGGSHQASVKGGLFWPDLKAGSCPNDVNFVQIYFCPFLYSI